MKLLLTPLAAALCLVGGNVRADSSCANMLKHTAAAEHALSASAASKKTSRSVLRTAARELEIAARAASECSDQNAKLQMRSVHERLSSILLAASDSQPAS